MQRHVARGMCGAGLGAILFGGWSAPRASASHISPPVLANTLRTPLPSEGYLEYKLNPASSRFGQEWTGWVDIRHPARDGTTQTFDPFDYSNRYVDVRTIIVTDNAGVEARPGGQAANTGNGIRRDFDYANKIYAQAGLSIIREGGGAITMNGAGGAPNKAWPADDPTLDVLNTLQRSANARTINAYYIKSHTSGSNGITGAPDPFGGNAPRNDGVNQADQAVNNTFAHEAGHMLFNDGAQHKEIPGDTPHSGDRTNLMWPDGTQTANSFADVGMLGRHDIVTSSQGLRIFGNAGANNPGFVQRNAVDTKYGNRVDWDFVADHGQLTFNHNNTIDGANVVVTGGAETVGNNVDEVTPTAGVDSLFYEIGNAAAPGAQAGHDHTGLGNFTHPGNFAGQSFKYADVFSLSLRYSDFDRNAAGAQSLKEGALDYDVVFRAADGSTAAGVPVAAFELGWTANTNADNFLTRWLSPIDATGMFIFAHLGNDHDYTTQIDAVIVGVPEPGSAAIFAVSLAGIAGRFRCRRGRA